MTRINIVPVEELSDQWLIAEYRELPRVLKGNFSIENAPITYKLGTGHVKWARKYGLFTVNRYNSILKEMAYRGFKPHFFNTLAHYLTKEIANDYKVTQNDIKISKERLIAKYRQNPKVHKWTLRDKPKYLN